MFELGFVIGAVCGIGGTTLWFLACDKDREKKAVSEAELFRRQIERIQGQIAEVEFRNNARRCKGKFDDWFQPYPSMLIEKKIRSEFDARKALAKQRVKRGRKP